MQSYTMQLDQDTRNSLNQHAYAVLCEAIASLELRPGSAVSENSLADQLGMSRSPIRQALKQLEHEGLVVTLPQRGTMVTKINEQEARDSVVMRKLLESWAISEIESKHLCPDTSRLSALLDLQAQAIAAGEYMRFLHFDSLYHECILAGADNLRAVSLFAQVNKSILRVRAWTLRQMKQLGSGIDEHREIYAAVIDRNWAAVRSLLISADDELLTAIAEMRKHDPDLFMTRAVPNKIHRLS